MTPLERACAYISKIPPAVSGQAGHAQTFQVACALVHGFALNDSDAAALLADYSARCSPPWNEAELAHKLQSARSAVHSKPAGHLLGSNPSFRPSKPASGQRSAPANPSRAPAKPKKQIEVHDTAELPAPIKDGARELLRAAFHEKEIICLCPATLNDEGREIPDGEGTFLSREEWLRLLANKDGNPNGVFSSSNKTGLYIRVNPHKSGKGNDADVSVFRHALFESDEISKVEQFAIFAASRLPITCLTDSGGKSIHAWVRLDACDRTEYAERQQIVAEFLAGYGFKLDPKNKNPSRFSRLPNCVRFHSRQELLALNVGAESFTEWVREMQADGIGETHTSKQLLEWKPEDDSNTLLGNRWICKGGSFLLSAPSGIGKSTIEMQLAVAWCVGLSVWNIAVPRPLKILIVQAENDTGDLAESHQGAVKGFQDSLEFGKEFDLDLLQKNFVCVTLTTAVGEDCLSALHKLVDKHRPDICWIDPAAAFVGDDIARQPVIAEFFRRGLNSIAKATGVAWFIINHTTKPSQDSKSKSGWQSFDYQHSGAGSYDLPGWARAVAVLEQAGENLFRLRLAKRGKRAGATHLTGEPTSIIWLQHSPDSIFWQQIDAPEKQESGTHGDKKGGRKDVKAEVAAMNLSSFLADCTAGEGLNIIAKRLENWLGAKSIDVSLSSAKRIIPLLVANGKLAKNNDSNYTKGANA